MRPPLTDPAFKSAHTSTMTDLECDAARIGQYAYLAQMCIGIHAGAQVVVEFCKAGTHRLVHGLCVLGFAARYIH
ncbi:hypothetical protein SCNRRL3882_0085 [Streptomyces chartreusis NRRL 3882]|uniref:Uncharacterized protein n=1 Tax=Streptomyces chartreusis NRRL 3882 TaxID=1079985 RepID=A0A2N9AZV9_STRCX|nr:hypothetical protein SCNRRL3882_0085 [Streptomyces chartreusis NRRL 3882]